MVHAPSFSAVALDPTTSRMLMHKKDATVIYELISKEGVMVARKDAPNVQTSGSGVKECPVIIP